MPPSETHFSYPPSVGHTAPTIVVGGKTYENHKSTDATDMIEAVKEGLQKGYIESFRARHGPDTSTLCSLLSPVAIAVPVQRLETILHEQEIEASTERGETEVGWRAVAVGSVELQWLINYKTADGKVHMYFSSFNRDECSPSDIRGLKSNGYNDEKIISLADELAKQQAEASEADVEALLRALDDIRGE